MLNWSTIEGLGFLGSFWGEVIELAEDGDITGWTPAYVAELTGLKAEPERVWEAMAQNGWLDRRDGKVIVHDWLDCAATYLRGKYAKDNRQKLVEIWAVHGRAYGNPIGNPLDSRCTLPDLTRPTRPKDSPPAPPPGERKRFVKPTAQEVVAYAASIGFRLDGERFCAFYESKGWMVGKSPMKDWRSAVVTWKKDAPLSAMIVKRVPIETKPMTDEEQREGLAELKKLKTILATGKEVQK